MKKADIPESKKMKAEDYKQLYYSLLNRILKGEGQSSREQRQAAFDNANLLQPLSSLIDKIVHHAYKITDNDINAVKKAGYTEDQIFELMICGAAGQASRQYENGLSALAEAMKEGGNHAS